MKKMILAIGLLMASTTVVADDSGWEVQDNSSGFTGSIHISCNASVAHVEGDVNCTNNELTIIAGGSAGEKGKDFKYEGFTQAQLDNLKGTDGIDGLNGKDGKVDYTEINNTITSTVKTEVSSAVEGLDLTGNQLKDEDISDMGYIKEDTDTHRSDKSVVEATQEARDAIVSEQSTVDTLQDKTVSDNAVASQERDNNIQEWVEEERQRVMDVNFNQQLAINNNTYTNNQQDVMLADHEGRISTIENKIKYISQDMDKLRGGIAAAGALALSTGLRTVDHDNRFTLNPAVAYYEGRTALALALQVNVTNNFTVRVGASADLEELDTPIVGAAASIGW